MVATRLAFMQWFYALGKNFSSDVDPRMVKRSSLASPNLFVDSFFASELSIFLRRCKADAFLKIHHMSSDPTVVGIRLLVCVKVSPVYKSSDASLFVRGSTDDADEQ